MSKKPKPRRKSKAPASVPLSPKEIRELRRRIKYYDDPVRYVVYSDLLPGRGFRFFLDVSKEVYCLGDWHRATLFKQKRIAGLVAQAYSGGRKRALRVARVTLAVQGKRGRGTKR